ncbi:hypothetical protein CEXT_283961 [Caerostris extrusa]|uniref:Uncharacterized protein n=1 Tax=Caerostris extrusa TaxID=172846 RepID=A0AAV4VRN4_CAEEX|nr:hypothetical protein CEXT_283961 [Caerostris extrusa]
MSFSAKFLPLRNSFIGATENLITSVRRPMRSCSLQSLLQSANEIYLRSLVGYTETLLCWCAGDDSVVPGFNRNRIKRMSNLTTLNCKSLTLKV